MFDFVTNLAVAIVNNYQDAAEHAPPIDWSGLGGVPWLLGMTGATVIYMAYGTLQGVKRDRRAAQQALYREAEVQGHLRTVRRDWRGYAEY